jgi:hypothetical protein
MDLKSDLPVEAIIKALECLTSAITDLSGAGTLLSAGHEGESFSFDGFTTEGRIFLPFGLHLQPSSIELHTLSVLATPDERLEAKHLIREAVQKYAEARNLLGGGLPVIEEAKIKLTSGFIDKLCRRTRIRRALGEVERMLESYMLVTGIVSTHYNMEKFL